MKKVTTIFSIISNKFFIALVIFAVIMLFTDHNNLFEQSERKKELQALQDKKKYYLDEIEKTKKELADLNNNTEALEKYARENFYMKRDNEDIFIIDSPSGIKK